MINYLLLAEYISWYLNKWLLIYSNSTFTQVLYCSSVLGDTHLTVRMKVKPPALEILSSWCTRLTSVKQHKSAALWIFPRVAFLFLSTSLDQIWYISNILYTSILLFQQSSPVTHVVKLVMTQLYNIIQAIKTGQQLNCLAVWIGNILQLTVAPH